MKYKLSVYNDTLINLTYTLQRAYAVNIMLVWLYEYIILFFGDRQDECVECSKRICESNIPEDCISFVNALAAYRNRYVYTGTHNIERCLMILHSCVDRNATERLFETIRLPLNVCYMFWKCYTIGDSELL